MHRSLIICLGLFFQAQAYSQSDTVTGRVVSDSAGQRRGMYNIEIFIPSIQYQTFTDTGGYFSFVPKSNTGHTGIVARFGKGDSMEFMYHPPGITKPVLVRNIKSIGAVDIKGRRNSSEINSRGLQKIEILNEGEFKKAACCSLSESFETNNTVEVSNADGVSGIRQVEMLGLAGKYVNMTRDNVPYVRGLNVLTGLDNVPGPFVSGVHIAKGAGSVTNGFEGITGGLNFTLKSEPKDPTLFLNVYGSSQARAEINLTSRQRIDKRNYNYTYLHYHNRLKTWDNGHDGYADVPVGGMIAIGDYFKSYGEKTEKQIGILYSNSSRTGGDMANFTDPHSQVLRFKFKMDEERIEAFAKLGIFLNKSGSSSIGNILSVSHTQNTTQLNSLIDRQYKGLQKNLNYTSMWASDADKKWSTKSGINLVYDKVDEYYRDSSTGSLWEPERTEISAGIFSEIIHKGPKTSWVLGARVDRNNLYGIIFTPRFHLKHDVTKTQQFHFQAGLGRRTPWVLADNIPLLISNRRLMLNPLGNNPPPFNIANNKFAYGFEQEKGLNTGVSYTWHMMVFKLPSTLSFDGFYTYFLNQVVADRDRDPGLLIISKETGNATYMGQVDWSLKPHRRVEVKLSYRYVNSQMQTGGIQRIQAMQAPHRGLVVFSYETRKKLFVDAIGQINSPKRLPSTLLLNEQNRRDTYSPWYTILNLQVRKEIRNWEIYAGGENLLKQFQKNPLLNVNQDGIQYFDAAFAWGPVMGRNFFFGLRLNLK